MHARLDAVSPLAYLPEIHAPLLVFCHDRDDLVIPVGESRRLRAALAGRPGCTTPSSRCSSTWIRPNGSYRMRLVQELGKFYHYVYPVFRQAVAG